MDSSSAPAAAEHELEEMYEALNTFVGMIRKSNLLEFDKPGSTRTSVPPPPTPTSMPTREKKEGPPPPPAAPPDDTKEAMKALKAQVRMDMQQLPCPDLDLQEAKLSVQNMGLGKAKLLVLL